MAFKHHASSATEAGGSEDTQTEDKRPAWQTIRDLLPYLWPSGRLDLKIRVVISLAVMLAGKAVIVYVPFFYKGAVDALTLEDSVETAVVVPLFLILAYGVARIVGLAASQVRYAVFSKVSEALTRRLAVKVFGHLHRLSLRYHLDRRTGGLARIVDRGVGYADFLLSIVLFNILPALVELAFVTVILISFFGVEYAAVTFGTVVLYVAFTFIVSEWRKKIRREMNDQDTDANAKAIDSFLNYETVKYFNNEDHEAERFDRARAAYEKASVRTLTSLAFLNAGQTTIFSIGLTILMVMAGFDIAAGALTVGGFVMVNTYLIQLSAPLDSLGFVYRNIRDALIDSEKLLDILNLEPEVQDRPGAKPLAIDGAAIRFDTVDFHYGPERQILRGVSFSVPPGRTVAVVGPTGAGKSTLARLMYRFYDVTGGAVTIDGQDLRDLTQQSVRKAIGMVPQDTVLFNDTIGYNIRYGRPDATEAEVIEAARLAQIHAFVESLPQGYDTVVGERGLKLSGGEKQRVAIARTILKNPPILILDEATSALDSRTERDIQAALKTVSANRTTLVIAHRLSTVMDADEIIVLEAGEVVEAGSHGDLLSKDGLYSAMWARQRDEVDAEPPVNGAASGEGNHSSSCRQAG